MLEPIDEPLVYPEPDYNAADERECHENADYEEELRQREIDERERDLRDNARLERLRMGEP